MSWRPCGMHAGLDATWVDEIGPRVDRGEENAERPICPGF